MENVVATRKGPVVIDLETLSQPGTAGAAVAAPAPTPIRAPPPPETCLATGLLTFVEGGPDNPTVEMGGLRGAGARPGAMPRRVWKRVGTAAVQPVEEPRFVLERPTP